MNLQLYQVDQKSFLLDFKSLTEGEEEKTLNTSASMVSQQSNDGTYMSQASLSGWYYCKFLMMIYICMVGAYQNRNSLVH